MSNGGEHWRALELEADFNSYLESTRADYDALRAIARGIPDPVTYARLMPLDIAAILVGANGIGASRRVHHGRIGELRSMGLVECGGCFVTAFGLKVTRALLEMDA